LDVTASPPDPLLRETNAMPPPCETRAFPGRRLQKKFPGILAAFCFCAVALNAFAESVAPAPPPAISAQSPGRSPADPAVLRGGAKVDWRELNASTLLQAARDGKPVFLFVTAAWCHWGRVMDRVTFGDTQVAARLNEDFIPVRLDRDLRPDIDVRLQQAAQLIAGTRGWPLVMCLTPEGRPFFAGTFFPPDDDPVLSRLGLRSTLCKLSQSWRLERTLAKEKALAVEGAMFAAVKQDSVNSLPFSPEFLARIVQSQQERLLHPEADKTARFPEPAALELLLRQHGADKDPRSLDAVKLTLDAMLAGAVYDQLEGGFHRYCADPLWRAPKFEKMCFGNAEMLLVCALAWQAGGSRRYRQAAEESLRLWDGPLSDPSRTYFFSSQAADVSDVDDGDYFTWTAGEVERALPDDADCKLARMFYGIGEIGDLPQTAPDRNILYQHLPLPKAAALAGVPAGQAEARLRQVRQALLLARRARPAPILDRTAYVDANALMAAAFIDSGKILADKHFVERGLKTLRALLKDGVAGAGDAAATAHVAGQACEPARLLAQDEAALGWACVAAFEATGDEDFAAEAEKSFQRLEKFRDAKGGGYFDRLPATDAAPPDLPLLRTPMKTCLDSSEPSANILAAKAWLRLGALLKKPGHRARAGGIVAAFAPILEACGPYGASLFNVAVELSRQK
jgi:uncharacterized protein YyaL (SSP411 family)